MLGGVGREGGEDAALLESYKLFHPGPHGWVCNLKGVDGQGGFICFKEGVAHSGPYGG